MREPAILRNQAYHKQLITGWAYSRHSRNPRYAHLDRGSPLAHLRRIFVGWMHHSLRGSGSRTSEILGISGLAGFQTPQSTTPDQHLHLRARRSTGASRVGSTSTPCEGLARTTSLSAFTRAASFFRFNLAST